jgi:hypothetical protein
MVSEMGQRRDNMSATDTPLQRHSDPIPQAKRTRVVDPATRAIRWAKIGRTREAALYRATVRRLHQHVGGKPSQAQELLIGRIAWLQVHVARIDECAMQAGELSPHAVREYLAWSNSIAKMLSRLGLEAPSSAEPSRDQVLAALYGRADGR